MADRAAPAAVSIRQVCKSFGALRAVDGVSIDIAPGSFFSLLGPSGCGKSTLMRLLAGFEQPDAGAVLIDGEDMAGVPPQRRPVNMMFQSYALFPHLNVAGNVEFGLRQQGVRGAALAERRDAMLTLTQLEGLAGRKPHQLSGGQRQRVALARALARAPKVLLLDEPLGALDKKLRQETQAELKRIQAASGATFIVVTHDQEEAMALSDRMAIMREGRIIQVDAPAAVYENPADLFVAGFVGEVNRLGARRAGAGRIVIQGLSEPIAGDLPAAEAVAVIRPERLLLAAMPHDAAECWLQARILDRTHLGPNVAYRLETAEGLRLKALVPSRGETGHSAGDPVWAGFRRADLRLLAG
jgi:putrescine transport system ATP-binding protein